MTDESKYETVFLGGLPDCSREEIIKLCASTGRIASTRVSNHRSFTSSRRISRLNLLFNNYLSRRGYAFIDYFRPADADFGIKYLNGIKFKGKEISAEFARRRRRMRTPSTLTTTAHSQSFDNDDGSTSGPAVICRGIVRSDHLNALKFSESRRAFAVGLKITTSTLLIAARDPENTRLVPEAATTTTDIMVFKLAFTDPGLAKTVTATMTPWTSPKLILLPILASNLITRGDDTILGPSLPLLGTIMMLPIQPLQYHYIRHFHRILNMFQVGSMRADLLKHDRSSYDNKYSQRNISPSYHSPPQHMYEGVDRESAHSRGYTRSKEDSAQGHRSQINSGRQNSDPDSASDVDCYTGNYRKERSTTPHHYYLRSPSPGLARVQAPRRNAISGDHYYSRDFFEASVRQGAYHY
ncbi:hypothetical protein F5877DRAFT_72758 [Lentinula edodes]|nr:hypothetical protein F5877DRAFT_72758 [Lentinula edodes]